MKTRMILERQKDRYLKPYDKYDYVAMTIVSVGAMIIAFLLGVCSTCHAEPLSITASRFIGQGETWGDNKGAFVERVLDKKEALPWCAGFVSFCLEENGHYGYIPYILRAKEYLKYGHKTDKPIQSDIVVFGRNGGGHVGIVYSVDSKGITIIEGNYGKYPARVKKSLILRGSKRWKGILAFRRLKVQQI